MKLMHRRADFESALSNPPAPPPSQPLYDVQDGLLPLDPLRLGSCLVIITARREVFAGGGAASSSAIGYIVT